MRIPWGTPTVSDAAKLGAVRAITQQSAWVSLGACMYELLLQPLITENFINLDAWSETDSGTNVNLSDGEVSMNGIGDYTANGLSYTAGVTTAHGCFEVKIKSATGAACAYFGLNSSNTLAITYTTPNWRTGTSLFLYIHRGNTPFTMGASPYTADVWYTMRIYIYQGPDGNLNTVRMTIQGGTEFPSETILEVWKTATLAATIYPQLMRYTNNASNLTIWKEFRWYSGYATDGPTLTYVADAGAGKTFGGFVPTNLAAVGSWATTNVLFKYSYDDGVADYNASWLTLAQLNDETALTTSKRYIRLQIQVNSDGATQQYAGEINADDATSMPAGGGYPAENDVRDGTTFGASSEYEGNLALPAEANVVPGVGYGSEGTEFEGSADLPALSSVDPLDTLLGDAGTMDVPDLANILPADTLRGVPGTSDKLYSAAEEAARNTVPTLSLIPTPATGGPDAWQQLGVERVGTLNLDAAKLTFEAGRNDNLAPERVEIDFPYKNLGEDKIGTLQGGEAQPDPSEWDGELSLGSNPGEIIVPIKGADGVRTYVFWRKREDGEEWSDPDINFSVVGEGTVTITGLDLGYTWEVDILSYSGGIYGRSPGPKSITLEAESSAATDNINTAKKAMKQSAVYWPRTGTDEFGKPSYGDATEIDCRWDEVQEEFIAPDGTRQLSMAKLIVDRDLKVGGVLYLGGIADLTDVDDPKSNEGAWEIRGVKKTPSFKGTKFLREVYL